MRPNIDEVMDRIITFYTETIIPMAKGNPDAVFTGLGLMLVRGYHGSEPKVMYEASWEIRKALESAKDGFRAAGLESPVLESEFPVDRFSEGNFPTVEQLREENDSLNDLLEALILEIYSLDEPPAAVNTIHADLRATMKNIAEQEYEATTPVLAKVMNSLP